MIENMANSKHKKEKSKKEINWVPPVVGSVVVACMAGSLIIGLDRQARIDDDPNNPRSEEYNTKHLFQPEPESGTTEPLNQPDEFYVPETNERITKGSNVVVSGTEGYGLNVRSNPGVNEDVSFIAQEGDEFLVMSSPEKVGDYYWVEVSNDNGFSGFVAVKYLTPVKGIQ